MIMIRFLAFAAIAILCSDYRRYDLLTYAYRSHHVFHPTPHWTKPIKANFRTFLQEFKSFEKTNVAPTFADIDSDQSYVDRNGNWKTLWIQMYGKTSGIASQFPKTLEILENTPAVSIMFSSLPVGSKLELHEGPYKGVLRYHLGLEMSDNDARIELYNSSTPHVHYWHTGQDVMFDDTFLHVVQGPSTGRRLILWLDVPRDDLTFPLSILNKCFIYAAGIFSKVPMVMHRHDKIIL